MKETIQRPDLGSYLFPERTQKPVGNKDFISVFIPTRNRPEFLRDIFNSLEDTTARKDLLDVWIYVDDDDSKTLDFIQTLQPGSYGFALNFVVGPRPISQGEMLNSLRNECSSNPGLYVFASDKSIFLDLRWDEVVRTTFNRYPDRILFAYPMDNYHGAYFGSGGCLSAEALNLLGRFFLEAFPYWFDDSWLNQVFMLVGRRVRLPMWILFQEGRGKTMRMRNLVFWRKFFEVSLPERIQESSRIREFLYQASIENFDRQKSEGEKVKQRLLRSNQSIEHIRKQEGKFAKPDMGDVFQDQTYLTVEKRALRYLLAKIDYSIEMNFWDEAKETGKILSLACQKIPGFEMFLDSLYKVSKSDQIDSEYLRDEFRKFMDFLGPEPIQQLKFRVISIAGQAAGSPFNFQPKLRLRRRRKFRRIFLKRYTKLAFLEFLNTFVPGFESYYGLDPYPPERFPFSFDELRFYFNLWKES